LCRNNLVMMEATMANRYGLYVAGSLAIGTILGVMLPASAGDGITYPEERISFRAYDQKGGIDDMAFSSDGKRLATFVGFPEVKAWDLKSQKCLETITFPTVGERAYQAARGGFLPTGDLLLVAPRLPLGNVSEVWKCYVPGGAKEHVLTTRRNELGHPLWTDKNLLVVKEDFQVNDKGALRFVDVAGKRKDMVVRCEDRYRLLTFSPDRSAVALEVGYPDVLGNVRIFEIATGKVLGNVRTRPLTDTRACLLSADNKILITVGVGKTFDWVDFWDVASGKELYRRPARSIIERLGDISPDGRLLAVLVGRSAIQFFDFKTEQFEHTYGVVGARFECLRFAPDGKTFATGEENGMVRIYDTPKVK
jgi:WD40 repeat protein